jgi:hypothetical protein
MHAFLRFRLLWADGLLCGASGPARLQRWKGLGCVCVFEIERFRLLIIVFCGDNKRQQWFVLCFLIWKKRVHDIFFSH